MSERLFLRGDAQKEPGGRDLPGEAAMQTMDKGNGLKTRELLDQDRFLVDDLADFEEEWDRVFVFVDFLAGFEFFSSFVGLHDAENQHDGVETAGNDADAKDNDPLLLLAINNQMPEVQDKTEQGGDHRVGIRFGDFCHKENSHEKGEARHVVGRRCTRQGLRGRMKFGRFSKIRQAERREEAAGAGEEELGEVL
jgi:hypothetical protein